MNKIDVKFRCIECNNLWEDALENLLERLDKSCPACGGVEYMCWRKYPITED